MSAVVHGDPELVENLQAREDIIDNRDIAQDNRFIREYTSREHWQHGILVSHGLETPRKPPASLDLEAWHEL